MKIVLASNNKGKLREFTRLLAPLQIEVHPQGEFNVPAAEEPFGTFIENCLLKARHASKITGLPAIADDSGICVNALGGAPGVYSARFSGEGATDEKNNDLLVKKLQDAADRSAHYTCVLVAVRHADDPEPVIAEGRWYGEVVDTPAGNGGFGYDPHFYLPELRKTAAQLTADEKNAISHRGQAMVKLIDEIQRRWAL
ncbi:MAG: RdgB/HAM1 family non-canonical purine NTP pyrophosphatase [Candidatus Aphodousia sp.]|nr:RdgB/HAM1 family non-canonical purine NTP pyrophosphatase [Sutterella sp.]MDY2899885.1 RdgB/HAM1 family non-canonical purine NTP pyrophosphatase [Candidatus Aphodousia sp.]